jgi:hypothetical protein
VLPSSLVISSFLLIIYKRILSGILHTHASKRVYSSALGKTAFSHRKHIIIVLPDTCVGNISRIPTYLNNVFRHGFTQLFGVIVAHFDRLAFSLLDQLFLLISKRLIVIFEITKYDLRIPKLDQLPRLLETQLIHQRRGFISRRAS